LSQGSRRVSKRPRQALAEVLECHHLSGADSFIIKAAASSVSHLETIVARFSAYGQTTTSIVLSSSLPGRSARRELTGDQAENH
jgi:Lrp/AsnC family leucine-responsive transcriptional regulator